MHEPGNIRALNIDSVQLIVYLASTDNTSTDQCLEITLGFLLRTWTYVFKYLVLVDFGSYHLRTSSAYINFLISPSLLNKAPPNLVTTCQNCCYSLQLVV